mgnify:CR=1 FL=1
MELLMNTQKECQQLEVYGEYLKKIPELLKQLETVEKMYQKAVLEEAMLKDKPLDNHSVQLYAERLHRIKEQCEIRSADIRQQCTLILELKSQIEAESSVLKALQRVNIQKYRSFYPTLRRRNIPLSLLKQFECKQWLSLEL